MRSTQTIIILCHMRMYNVPFNIIIPQRRDANNRVVLLIKAHMVPCGVGTYNILFSYDIMHFVHLLK